MDDGRKYVRIVSTPAGEAPLWVREKWIGLELPLADKGGRPQRPLTSGVLTGPRYKFLGLLWFILGKLQRQSGYAVYVKDALESLEKTSPEAAAWWRANAPRLQGRDRKFLFLTGCCERIPH